MKKILNILLILVMTVSSTVIGVRAEGNSTDLDNDAVTGNTATQGMDATVDEVAETTYGATITWGDLKYDWVNIGGPSYSWQAKETCQAFEYQLPYDYTEWSTTQGTAEYDQYLDSLSQSELDEQSELFYGFYVETIREINSSKVYLDSTCQTKPDNYYSLVHNRAVFSVQYDENNDPVLPKYTLTYYAMVPSNNITIIDESVAGSIVPIIEWNPADKYYWTSARAQIYQIYKDTFFAAIDIDEATTIPTNARVNMDQIGQSVGYKLRLELAAVSYSYSATASNATGSDSGARLSRYYKPSSDDTIGTLTIRLSAAE